MSPQHTPLGAPGLYIQTLLPGSPAAADGRLSLGDRILEVNGSSLMGVSYLRYPKHTCLGLCGRQRGPGPGPPAAQVTSAPVTTPSYPFSDEHSPPAQLSEATSHPSLPSTGLLRTTSPPGVGHLEVGWPGPHTAPCTGVPLLGAPGRLRLPAGWVAASPQRGNATRSSPRCRVPGPWT